MATAPKQQFLQITDFTKGYNSTLDDERLAPNQLKTASNMIVEQNGTLRPRPSLSLYGTQPLGTVLGQVRSVIRIVSGKPEKWEISMQNVAGTANVYARKDDGGSFTLCTGKTYSNTAAAHFEQIASKVVISNGVDNLSYLDLTNLTITSFNSLTTPTGLTAAQTGLTGTTYTYYYRVTALNQGETVASSAASVQVVSARNAWTGVNASTPQYVTLTFNRVTGANNYAVYLATTSTGDAQFLDFVADPGSGTTVTYKDGGSTQVNVYRIAPITDSTAGPSVTRSKNIGGQLYMVGDVNNLYRVWYGGTGSNGGNALKFTPEAGGGYIDLDPGGENMPVSVSGFRDNKGNPLAVVLSQGISGRGTLTNLSPANQTLGSTVIAYMSVSQSESQTGTDSPDGVINYQQSLWYPSRDGFKTTATKAQIQNLLSTDTISDNILNDIAQLNVVSMPKCVGVAFQNRLYWALPVGNSTNNQIWVFDPSRGNLWTLPWYVSADWMWIADDNNGVTHFKVLSNNKIYEFNYGQFTRDDQTAFSTNAVSGLLKFDDTGNSWGDVASGKVTYLRPQGTMTFSVSGMTEDSAPNLVPLASDTYVASSTNVQVGWNEAGWNRLGWNRVGKVPTQFGSQTITRYLEIDEEVKYLQCNVSSTVPGTDFQVSKIIFAYVDIGPQDGDTT